MISSRSPSEVFAERPGAKCLFMTMNSCFLLGLGQNMDPGSVDSPFDQDRGPLLWTWSMGPLFNSLMRAFVWARVMLLIGNHVISRNGMYMSTIAILSCIKRNHRV